MDSNHEWLNQNQQCYHYTTGQFVFFKLYGSRRLDFKALDFKALVQHSLCVQPREHRRAF